RNPAMRLLRPPQSAFSLIRPEKLSVRSKGRQNQSVPRNERDICDGCCNFGVKDREAPCSLDKHNLASHLSDRINRRFPMRAAKLGDHDGSPSWAKRMAIASSIPAPLPVTIATLFCS